MFQRSYTEPLPGVIMLEKMYWVCSDLFSLVAQLATGRDLPSHEILERHANSLLDQMVAKARQAGISDADLNDAKYALVAVIDELIFRSQWLGREQWMRRPLLLAHFNDETPGAGFIAKMRALHGQPERQYVLEVYYESLRLSFHAGTAGLPNPTSKAPGHCMPIPLQTRSDGMHIGKLDDPRAGQYEFYLVASGSSEADLRARLPKLLKIASWNQIGSILQSPSNGVRIDFEQRPPRNLSIEPGMIVFKVIREGALWADIATTGTIAMYLPVEPNSLRVKLYTIDPAQA